MGVTSPTYRRTLNEEENVNKSDEVDHYSQPALAQAASANQRRVAGSHHQQTIMLV